jgi:hypothetical protein
MPSTTNCSELGLPLCFFSLVPWPLTMSPTPTLAGTPAIPATHGVFFLQGEDGDLLKTLIEVVARLLLIQERVRPGRARAEAEV